MITSDSLARILRRVIKAEGSQHNAAKKLGVSAQYLGDVLHGRLPVAARLATALGYRRVVMFARVRRR